MTLLQAQQAQAAAAPDQEGSVPHSPVAQLLQKVQEVSSQDLTLPGSALQKFQSTCNTATEKQARLSSSPQKSLEFPVSLAERLLADYLCRYIASSTVTMQMASAHMFQMFGVVWLL